MPTWRKLHIKVVESFDVNDMPDDFVRLLWVLLPTQLCSQGRGPDEPTWVRSRVFPLRADVTLEMMEEAMRWFAAQPTASRPNPGTTTSTLPPRLRTLPPPSQTISPLIPAAWRPAPPHRSSGHSEVTISGPGGKSVSFSHSKQT